MKKLVFVLGLIVSSMIASDALAYSSVNGVKMEINHSKPTKDKKKKKSKKSCCKPTGAASTTGCPKDHGSCCKKKTAETPNK